MKINKTFTIIFISFLSLISYSQDKNDKFDYGVSAKLELEVQKFTNLRLSIVGGIAKKIEKVDFLYPAIHLETVLYNGGIGSSLSKDGIGKLYCDVITSFSLTGGRGKRNNESFNKKFSPLNFFSNFSAYVFQNPYYNSISLGSNYIISINSNKKNQLVGMFNANIGSYFQLTYCNDGTPFGNWLGDGQDRYYTGIGVLGYYGNHNDIIDNIELSFHKFTGYQPHLFDFANSMQIDIMPYKDTQGYYYNQNRFSLRVGNYGNNYSFFASMYDSVKYDSQDWIHYLIDNAYHPDFYRDTRFGFGVSLTNNF